MGVGCSDHFQVVPSTPQHEEWAVCHSDAAEIWPMPQAKIKSAEPAQVSRRPHQLLSSCQGSPGKVAPTWGDLLIRFLPRSAWRASWARVCDPTHHILSNGSMAGECGLFPVAQLPGHLRDREGHSLANPAARRGQARISWAGVGPEGGTLSGPSQGLSHGLGALSCQLLFPSWDCPRAYGRSLPALPSSPCLPVSDVQDTGGDPHSSHSIEGSLSMGFFDENSQACWKCTEMLWESVGVTEAQQRCP